MLDIQPVHVCQSEVAPRTIMSCVHMKNLRGIYMWSRDVGKVRTHKSWGGIEVEKCAECENVVHML